MRLTPLARYSQKPVFVTAFSVPAWSLIDGVSPSSIVSRLAFLHSIWEVTLSKPPPLWAQDMALTMYEHLPVLQQACDVSHVPKTCVLDHVLREALIDQYVLSGI